MSRRVSQITDISEAKESIKFLSVFDGFSELKDCIYQDEVNNYFTGKGIYVIYDVLIKNKDKQIYSRTWIQYNNLLFFVVEQIILKKKYILDYLEKEKSASKSEADFEYLIILRDVLNLCILMARKDSFWYEYNKRLSINLNAEEKDGENVLEYLFKKTCETIPEDFVRLEKDFKLLSLTINYFSKNYSLGRASYLYQSYYNHTFSKSKIICWTWARLKVLFSIPITIGIIVGWIFLLQAGDAVKYFTIMQLLEYNIILEASAIFVPIILSVLYIYNHAHIKNRWRIALLIFIAWFISLNIGLVFMIIGYQWFILQNDWTKEWTPDFVISLSEYNAIRFVLIWSSMAVFIGIFAQIIWSGRGPTEISE